MKKLKKILVIMFMALSLSSLGASNYCVSAKTTVQKGTLFNLKLDKNFSEGIDFLYTDVIIKNLKWYYKNLCNNNSYKQKMINNLFNNYKIINKGDSYIISFYFFKDKKINNYSDHLRFLRTFLTNIDYNNFNKIIEKTNEKNKNYSKIDNKFISEKLKNFIISYCNSFYNGIKNFENKIIEHHNEKNYEYLYEIFDSLLKSNIKNNICFSSIVSSKIIRNKIKEIVKILDYIIKNDLKDKEKYDFDEDFYFDRNTYDEYDEYDDDDYNIFYEDDEYEEYEKREKYKKYNRKKVIEKNCFMKLKNKIKSLIGTSIGMIKKLKILVSKNSEKSKHKLDDIIKSLKSVRFVDKPIKIEKKTKTSSKTSEKIFKA